MTTTSTMDLALAFGGYVLLAAFLATILFILKRFVKWYFSPLHMAVPGPEPPGGFWLGMFPEIVKEPFMAPHLRAWKAAGPDTKMLHYTQILGSSSLLILDREIVKTILTAPAGKPGRPRFRKQLEFVKNIMGDGLLTLEGEDWMRHRRILQPSFGTQFLRETLQRSVPAKVEHLIRAWSTAEGREIHVVSHLSALTLDVIGDVAFAHNFHGVDAVERWSHQKTKPSPGDGDDEASTTKGNKSRNNNKHDADASQLPTLDDPFLKSLTQAILPSVASIIFSLLGLAKLDGWINPRVMRSRRSLDRAADRVVQDGSDAGAAEQKSLLSLMRHAQDPETSKKGRQLSDAEIRNEIKLFMVAGHETTATWCHWALFALAKFPDVQERVYSDVVKHAPLGKEITIENVEKMEYLNAFLQEVLRLYPPAGAIIRYTNYPETFDGVDIPVGTRLFISTFLLHRHPHYWDDPETFSPERWLNVSDAEWERRRFVFIPFSAGGRNCIGQRFASIEAQLILAPLVRSLCVQIAPSQRNVDFTFTSRITLKSKPPLKIVVKKRV